MKRGGPPPPPGPLTKKAPGGPPPPSKAVTAPPPKPKPQSPGNDLMSELAGRFNSSKDYEPQEQASRPQVNRPTTRSVMSPTIASGKRTWGVAGPQEVAQNTRVEFKLSCKNENKQPIDVDVNSLETEMWTKTDRDGSLVKGIISKKSTGIFALQFNPKIVGRHVLNVWVTEAGDRHALFADHDLVRLDVNKEEPKVLDELHFTANGQGLMGGNSGRTTNFDIWCKDSAGRIRDVDADQIVVTVSQGIIKINATVKRKAPGHYQAVYTPSGSGEFTIRIRYGSNDVVKKNLTFR